MDEDVSSDENIKPTGVYQGEKQSQFLIPDESGEYFKVFTAI